MTAEQFLFRDRLPQGVELLGGKELANHITYVAKVYGVINDCRPGTVYLNLGDWLIYNHSDPIRVVKRTLFFQTYEIVS